MQLLCDMGTTQAVVLMPLHPRLLAAVRGAGWQKRHDEVMTYLSGLQGRYGFGLLDRSHLATFNGDPQQFYDGFHVKRANARRLTRNVVAELPSAFAAVAGTRPLTHPRAAAPAPARASRPQPPAPAPAAAARARARARAGRSRPHARLAPQAAQLRQPWHGLPFRQRKPQLRKAARVVAAHGIGAVRPYSVGGTAGGTSNGSVGSTVNGFGRFRLCPRRRAACAEREPQP